MPILDQCEHQFIWPQRAPDGHYYQVCRLCEAEYEFDWDSMQRLSDVNAPHNGAHPITPTPETDQEHAKTPASTPQAIATVTKNIASQPEASLKFVLETAPAHRVFFENLTDLVSQQPRPTAATVSGPGMLWHNVFVDYEIPWLWFAESLLGHVIVITGVLLMFQLWPAGPIELPTVFHRSYVSYYIPPESYPALGSHHPTPRAKTPPQSHPAPRPTIHVAGEPAQQPGQQPAAMQAPELKAGKAGKLNVEVPASAAPIMPLSSTGYSNQRGPAAPTWIVAPPPDATQAGGRRSGGIQASAVGPAPEISGISSGRGRGISGSSGAIIGPPPSVSSSMRRGGFLSIGESAVVNPAPVLPTHEQSAASGKGTGVGMLGGLGIIAVPPAPSVQGTGAPFGGRTNSLSGNGLRAVAPSPSVEGTGNTIGSGRGALSTGVNPVPPPPSALGEANGAGSGRGGSFSSGLQPVAPAPSVGGDGSGSGRGHADSLAGVSMEEAMPPASSGTGTGTGPGSGAGTGAIGSSGSGETSKAGDGGDSGPTSVGIDPNEPATVEIPLRLIAPVLALPGSSYFSNYEVFIAERKVGQNQPLLIKLVYTSLPYQRRLAEYAANGSTVNKLRITRDRTCDESLLQMTWPETDPRPDSQNMADAPNLSSKDRKGMLPCYRTTADDFRRAIGRNR